jgi:two-component sensor histidine kinase
MGYIGSCVDISEIRRSREQLEISLKEKVVLLKEIHHRVKNNLQIISSLLNLQSAYIGDNEVKEIFIESQNRVKSMALIHEKLYLSGNLSEINFSEYLRELITNLLNSYRNKLSSIDLEIKIDNLELNVDFSVNLGLVINELVTNTLKHAFPDGNGSGGTKSKLYVLLNVIDKSKFKIILKDNGCGFPETLDFRNTQSLGMQLVVSLVDQLKGKIELNRNGGTEFILTF